MDAKGVESRRQPPSLVIEGTHILGIPSFYAEINRVFMADEDWQLGPSLDALDDMLHGGYGALHGVSCPVVTWRNIAASRAALGVEETRRFYLERIALRPMFNGSAIRDLLDALERGRPISTS